MGGKPSAAKNLVKAYKRENTVNPSLEGSGNIKPLLEGEKSQLENPNPSLSGVGLHHGRSPAQEHVNPKSEPHGKSTASRRKKSRYNTAVIRRSERVKSAVVHTSNQVTEPYIEDLTVSGEKDEPVTQMAQVLQSQRQTQVVTVWKKKVDYALQQLEAFKKIVESLQSKVVENVGLDETPSAASLSYRRLYVDSQKKLEVLMDENQQLTGKLQNALGKVEVFEKKSRVLIEVLEKVKNALAISNLTKTT